MTPPKIKALGITQEWPGTRWKACGHVEGVGRLEAWGPSLLDAMHALQTLAAQRVAEQAVPGAPTDGEHRHGGGGGL
jgi:hypothetical protein